MHGAAAENMFPDGERNSTNVDFGRIENLHQRSEGLQRKIKQLHAASMAEGQANAERAELPEHLKRFLIQQIDSVEQLEILLLIGDRSERQWTVSEVYAEIKSSLGSVRHRLDQLTEKKLLTRSAEGGYQISFEGRPGFKELLDELNSTYRECRVRVVEFIYSKVPDAVSEFARAFRIRGNS